MKFYGLRVYDMAESIVASGFPMLKKKYTPKEWEWEVKNLKRGLEMNKEELLIDMKLPKEERQTKLSFEYQKAINHLRRACNLGNAIPGSGHDCMLKGVIVSVNIEADQSFWLQWERYHFQDTVSSMSTMHCLCKFEKVDEMFSKYTDPRTIAILNEKIEAYNNNPTSENFHQVIHNCPQGIELCRRLVMNYLQIKSMLNQRKNHKMESWREGFVSLTKELPFFEEMTQKVKQDA